MSSTCQSCSDRAGCREAMPALDAGDLCAGGARTAELDSTGDKVARARWLREVRALWGYVSRKPRCPLNCVLRESAAWS